MAKKKNVVPDPEVPKTELTLPEGDAIGSADFFANEIDQSLRLQEKYIKGWRENLDRTYRANKQNSTPGRVAGLDTVVPSDFWNIEQKRGQLFYQTPDVQVTPERREVEVAAPKFQHILNFLLGRKEANAKAAVNRSLTDVLCTSGVGPTIIGYESERKPFPTGNKEPVIDPMTQMPVIDPSTLQPLMQDVLGTDGKPETYDKTIWSRYFWDHFSITDLLLPVGFLSTEYDKAPWIGRRFRMDPEQMAATYGVDKRLVGENSNMQKDTLAPSAETEFLQSCAVGYEIWLRARVYEPSAHPEEIRRLVLVGGQKKNERVAVVYEKSKYQQWDEATGELVKGMRGFPIWPLAIRLVTDQSIPPSDATVARYTADELSRGRSQMLKQRDRAIPIRGFDKTRVTPEVMAKIERGEFQAQIGFDGPVTEDMMREIAPASFPPEKFSFDVIANQTLEKIWGFSSNNLGALNDTGRTATEIAAVDRAKDIRIDTDRQQVLEWFVAGVEKFAALPQLFADEDRVYEWTGADGVKQIGTWNKDDIEGRYAFSIDPDSSVRINAAENRELSTRFVGTVTNNPHFNQLEVAKDYAIAFGKDPTKLVVQPQPKEDEPPKVSISIKGDDLDPSMPQYPNVLALFAAVGVKGLAPPTPPQAQPVPDADTIVKAPQGKPPVSKHDSDLTGQMPGPSVPGRVQ